MYNLLIIQTMNDGTKARSLVSFDTEKKAVNRMAHEMEYATAEGSNVAKVVLEIIDDDGHLIRCDKYGSEPILPVEDKIESEVSA